MSRVANFADGPMWKPEKTGPKPKKYIKQSGKVAQQWAKVKADFLKANPANHQGYRTCGICGGMVSEHEVDVDHKVNRSIRPDLRYEASNLQICHSTCNINKKVGL